MLSSEYSKRDLDKILKDAKKAAEKAGKTLSRYHRKGFTVSEKDDTSLVTEADVKAEHIIKKILQKEYPDFDFIGEESGTSKGARHSGFAWHVDPLDGTTNFAHKLPAFCTSIGLAYNDEPVLGVIYAPVMEEFFYGHVLGDAWCNKKKIHVSQRNRMADVLVATGFSFPKNIEFNDRIEQLARVLRACRGIRRLGAAALDLAYTARGTYDAFFDHRLNSWDTCAGLALIKAAGGKLTSLSGSEPLIYSPDVVATNKLVQKRFLDILRGTGTPEH